MCLPFIYTRKYYLLALLLLSLSAVSSQSPLARNNQKDLSNINGARRVSADTISLQSLIDVLRDLNRRKGVFFLYSEENMSQRLVNPVRDINDDVEKILEEVLKNTGLKHRKISDNTFVILNATEKSRRNNDYIKAELLDPDDNPVNALLPLAGKITDSHGQPLTGVSIRIKGTNKGVTTNARGQFFLEAMKGQTLVASYIGYDQHEYVITNDHAILISLELANKEMTEVIVTALGIRKESKQLGFSVSKKSGEEFTTAREINLGNALVGRVAGVNSSSPLTGPGGSSRVTIRGNSSLSFDNQPLYVINGIPMNNDNLGSAGKFGGADFGDGICSVNPDDIDELVILKGSAAAALYGQRGRNGVIIITTKSGKGKKALGIDLNSNMMVDVINDFTDFQDKYGQGFEGIKPNDQASALLSGLYAWGAPLDGSPTTLFDGQLHPYAAVGKNNLHEFYKTGGTLSNTLAISGGNETGNFRVSFGDLRNQSVYPHTRYNRNNVTLDLNYKLSDKWSGLVNASYIKETGKNRSNLSDAPGNGNFAIAFLPPNVRASYLSPGYDNLGNEIQYNDLAFNTNPYFAAAKFRNNTGRDRILGVASIRYSPFTSTYIQARIANDFFSFNASSITPSGTAYKPSGTINLERSYDYNELNVDILAGFRKDITPDINLDVTAGANLMKMHSSVLDISADGLAFPFIYNPGTASARSINLTAPRKEVQSVYASLAISFRDALFLTVTDRNDWSSTLPKDRNSYNYPSANVSWLIPATLRPAWLNYAKMRAGYAMVGGDAPIFATALYYNILGSVNGNPIGNLDNEVPNQGLEPLKVTELEWGTELKFLQGRLFADIAIYNKKTQNDIVATTVSVASGFTSALVNMGTIRNRGIELEFGGLPVKTSKFSWTTSLNYANNRNRVLTLANGQSSMQVQNGESRTERGFIRHIVGLPFSQVMVYDIKRDVKGNPVIGANGWLASDQLTAKGTGIHPVTGGWSNEFVYKQLSLSFLIDYKFGAVLYSGTNATAVQRGLLKETLEGRENGLTISGVDEQGDPVTKTISAQKYYNELYRISALQVYDAGFVKFRSLTLSYSVPARILRNKIAGLQFSLVGRNLFYIRKETPNIDPEANYSNSNAQGLEYAALPSVRSYGFNIHVKF